MSVRAISWLAILIKIYAYCSIQNIYIFFTSCTIIETGTELRWLRFTLKIYLTEMLLNIDNSFDVHLQGPSWFLAL